RPPGGRFLRRAAPARSRHRPPERGLRRHERLGRNNWWSACDDARSIYRQAPGSLRLTAPTWMPARQWRSCSCQGDRMKDLLTRALEAHGGLSRWRAIEAFELKVSIGGGLWRLKGLPDGLRDVTLRIQAHRPIVTITPFGGEARTGRFTPDCVWIEDANGGVVEERATPRASFAGHVLTTPWDKLQELYFVSYA